MLSDFYNSETNTQSKCLHVVCYWESVLSDKQSPTLVCEQGTGNNGTY